MVRELLSGGRGDIYGALASIFGALLGFTVTAMAIVLSASDSDGLKLLRGKKKAYSEMWAVFKGSIGALGLATTMALVALVLDRDPTDASPVILSLVLATTLFGSLRVWTAIRVLLEVVDLITRDHSTDS